MRLLILYGSQTGTAQDVAEQIWRESKQFGFTGAVLPMDDYGIQNLVEESLVVFVVATTGNGDEPDNMRQSWKFLLRRSLPANSLQRLQFVCLGLGDSSYAKYNYAAKKLNKRLLQLGARSLQPLGLCDDQHDYGLSAVSLPWIAQFWQELQSILPLTKTAIHDMGKDVFKLDLKVLDASADNMDETLLKWPFKQEYQHFMLTENQRTTSNDHFQDVRLLKFKFDTNNITWNAGDVLQVRPCNSAEKVEEFFALVEQHKLDFNAKTLVQLSAAHADMPVPLAYAQPVTIAQVAKYIWDFSWKPRQRAFELLALNCEDELEKEKLIEFTTAEGLDELIKYVNRPRRTILEVLQEFKHATSKLTLPILFELFPIIQARSFSIASMPSTGSLDLLVAVVEYKTIISKSRLGLCSNWLKSLQCGTQILGAIKAGTMQMPKDINTPIIMVGPGTGIAPFRSVIQQRAQEKQTAAAEIGEMIVFFGCRNKLKDYHFAQDFENWHERNLVAMHVAFSRDQEQKVYVQHLITKNKPTLSELIKNKNAFIYVAGSSKNMPKAVQQAFLEVLEGDDTYINNMIKNRRYQEETWA